VHFDCNTHEIDYNAFNDSDILDKTAFECIFKKIENCGIWNNDYFNLFVIPYK